jgi:RHS repeat-associated protein
VKNFLLVFGLFLTVRLLAVNPVPYSEAVTFSVRIQGGGGNVLMTVTDESGSPGVGTTLGSPPTTAVESDLQTAWLRPGKPYSVNLSGSGPTNYWMSFTAPQGYTVYIDGSPTNLITGTPGGGGYSDDYTIELRPLASSYESTYSAFSGVSLGKSVEWDVGLGSLFNGRGAGRIMFRQYDLTSSPASRACLYLAYPCSYRGTWTYYDGPSSQTLRQIGVPQGFIDIVDEGDGYTFKFYVWSDVEFSPGNPAILHNSPWKTIHVENTTTNELTIDEAEGSWFRRSVINAGDYTSNYTWTLKEGDASTFLRTTVHTSTKNTTVTPHYRDVVAEVHTGNSTATGTLVASTQYHYVTQSSGEEALAFVTLDPGSSPHANLKTTYVYHDTAPSTGSDEYRGNYRRVMSVTDPAGNWTACHYYNDWDNRGQLKYEFHPFKDTPSSAPNVATAAAATAAAAASNNGRVIYFTYTADWTGRCSRQTLRQESVNNIVTSKSIYAHGDNTGSGWPREYCTATNYRDSSASYSTYEEHYRGDAGLDDPFRPYQQQGSDQAQNSHSAVTGSFNSGTKVFTATGGDDGAYREVVMHGSTNGSGADAATSWDGQTFPSVNVLPYKSTLDATIRDSAGNVIRTESYVYTGSGSWSLMTYADLTYDAAGRLTQRVENTGATVTNTITNGLLTSTVGVDGTENQFTYDNLSRVATSIKKGASTSGYTTLVDITTSYTYDGANHVTQQIVTGGSLSLTSTSQFDQAGRKTQSVAPGGYTTNVSYSSGGRIVTTTLPGGTATKITEAWPDGRLKSITGSAVVAEYHEYGINTDGTVTHRIRTGADTSSVPYVVTTSNWLGQPVSEVKPAWSGTATRTWTYNSNGLLTKLTQPGLADTLYSYDTMGVLFRQCLDVSANGVIDLTSSDRITEYGWSYLSTGSAGDSGWFTQKTTSVYPPGSGSAKLVSKVERKLAGMSANRLSRTDTFDEFGNRTSSGVDVNRSDKLLATTTTYPDSSTSAVQLAYNGLVISSRDKLNLTTTFGFDDLGRPTSATDPRTGANKTVYFSGRNEIDKFYDAYAAAQLGSNPSFTPTASYHYDSAGRADWVADAAGKKTYTSYSDRGEVLRQWGDATYPVEYVYDAWGRRILMKTYRGGAGWNASEWPGTGGNSSNSPGTPDLTKWVYDDSTGMLKEKYDAANLDASGNPISGAKKVSYTYTAAGQLDVRTWARGIKTRYTYDPLTGEQTDIQYKLSDGTTNEGTPNLTYTYNRLGKIATVGDATTGTRTFNYNLAGTLELQSEDLPSYFGSRRITYPVASSGVIGRPTGLQLGTSGSPTSEQNVTYGYGGAGRFTGLGASGRTLTYSYAANANLLSSIEDTTSGSGTGWKQTRTYLATRDLLDEIETKYTTTSKAKFDYDPANNGSGHDALGRRLKVAKTGEIYSRYGNGSQGLDTTWTYDDRSQVISEVTKLGGSATVVTGRDDAYAWDNIGNRSSSAGTTHNANAANYTANALNQYTQRSVPGIFDVAGAASASATVTVNSSSTGVTRHGEYFFKGHPLTNTSPVFSTLNIDDGSSPTVHLDAFLPLTPEPFAYDDDGNLIRDGRWVYVYDAENRLIAQFTRGATGDDPLASDPANAAVWSSGVARQKLQFTYDYLGRRVDKLVSSWVSSSWSPTSEERFVYDGWNAIAKLNALSGNALVASYYWGLDWSGTMQGAGGVGGLALIVDGGIGHFPIFDGNGNVVGLVRPSTGALDAAYEFDAFGQTLRESGTYASINPFRFSTKYTDLETALVYYGLRYYSPTLGRFICRDPKEEDGGRNLYAFLRNNAINDIDVLGCDPWSIECGGAFWGSGSGGGDMSELAVIAQMHAAMNGEAAYIPTASHGDIYTVRIDGKTKDGESLPGWATLDQVLQANHLDENGNSTRGVGFSGTAGSSGIIDGSVLQLEKFVVNRSDSPDFTGSLVDSLAQLTRPRYSAIEPFDLTPLSRTRNRHGEYIDAAGNYQRLEGGGMQDATGDFLVGAAADQLVVKPVLGLAGEAIASVLGRVTRSTRGGSAPVLRGQAGVARAIAEIEANGGTILGREITLEAGGVRTRPDLLVLTSDGRTVFFEVKNGPGATLTPNQRIAFPAIRGGGAIPRGGNAATAGLPVGQPLPPIQVEMINYP